MAQTSVLSRQPKWIAEGQYGTTASRTVEGVIQNARNGNSVLPFGRVSQFDPVTGIITPLAGALPNGRLLVIPVLNERNGLTISSLINGTSIGYPPEELVDFIVEGDVVMWSEEAVNAGDPVHYRHTVPSGNTALFAGRVRKTAVSGETATIAATSARFMETTSDAGLVLVRVKALLGL